MGKQTTTSVKYAITSACLSFVSAVLGVAAFGLPYWISFNDVIIVSLSGSSSNVRMKFHYGFWRYCNYVSTSVQSLNSCGSVKTHTDLEQLTICLVMLSIILSVNAVVNTCLFLCLMKNEKLCLYVTAMSAIISGLLMAAADVIFGIQDHTAKLTALYTLPFSISNLSFSFWLSIGSCIIGSLSAVFTVIALYYHKQVPVIGDVSITHAEAVDYVHEKVVPDDNSSIHSDDIYDRLPYKSDTHDVFQDEQSYEYSSEDDDSELPLVFNKQERHPLDTEDEHSLIKEKSKTEAEHRPGSDKQKMPAIDGGSQVWTRLAKDNVIFLPSDNEKISEGSSRPGSNTSKYSDSIGKRKVPSDPMESADTNCVHGYTSNNTPPEEGASICQLHISRNLTPHDFPNSALRNGSGIRTPQRSKHGEEPQPSVYEKQTASSSYRDAFVVSPCLSVDRSSNSTAQINNQTISSPKVLIVRPSSKRSFTEISSLQSMRSIDLQSRVPSHSRNDPCTLASVQVESTFNADGLTSRSTTPDSELPSRSVTPASVNRETHSADARSVNAETFTETSPKHRIRNNTFGKEIEAHLEKHTYQHITRTGNGDFEIKDADMVRKSNTAELSEPVVDSLADNANQMGGETVKVRINMGGVMPGLQHEDTEDVKTHSTDGTPLKVYDNERNPRKRKKIAIKFNVTAPAPIDEKQAGPIKQVNTIDQSTSKSGMRPEDRHVTIRQIKTKDRHKQRKDSRPRSMRPKTPSVDQHQHASTLIDQNQPLSRPGTAPMSIEQRYVKEPKTLSQRELNKTVAYKKLRQSYQCQLPRLYSVDNKEIFKKHSKIHVEASAIKSISATLPAQTKLSRGRPSPSPTRKLPSNTRVDPSPTRHKLNKHVKAKADDKRWISDNGCSASDV